ncbi:MAG: InlB B-repeat-containing protein, partial [Clostridia bacterium]|nr:InlB B-repeat-containing protein [Clostridia bacterium]
VTSDITLEAQWIINSYTVTFDANGGTEVEDQSVNYGYTATQPQTTYKLHTLVGWYLDGEAYDFSTTVTADISLKAKWSIEDSNTLMLTDITIDTSSMTTAYNVGDKLSTSGLSLTLSISSTEGDITALVVSMTIDGTEYIFDDVTIAGELTIDSSEYDNTAAGTYTIYVGYTLNGITRWASYDVTVTSVISGTHGIELEKTTTEYTLVETGKEASVIDLTDITVYSVNDDGTLGTAITEGISYKYYEGATEITAADITNGKVTNYQVWAYVDYTVGNETYVMSDFVLITIIGDEITALEWADGTNSQAQSLTDSMSATWTLNATYSLTGDTVIDLSKCTVGTAAGQYTVDIKTTVTGSYTAVVTYYYQLGNDVIPATCEVEYKITESTVVESYSVLIDVNVGTDDVADSTGVTDVISAGLSDGDVIVENLVYTYGSLSTNTENKAGANGEDKLYGRVQFSTAKGITVYLGGAATVTLYARYGSSSGDGAAFVVKDSEGNTVVTSDLVSNKSAYETVTLTIESAGIYTIVASTGSLNTFRIAISGTVGTDSTYTYKTLAFDVNSFTAADVATVSANLAIDDTFTLISGSKTPAIKDISESPVTIEDKTFTYQINMGSSKQSDDSDSVKFEVTEAMLTCGSVTLTVYANHGGGEGSTRILGVYTTGNKSSNYQYSAEVDGGGVVVTIEIDKAGTYYFGSSSSGLNFYYMELSYKVQIKNTTLEFDANSFTAADVATVSANLAID